MKSKSKAIYFTETEKQTILKAARALFEMQRATGQAVDAKQIEMILNKIETE